jgi:phenylalanyl-tRNA synthetase beta chain
MKLLDVDYDIKEFPHPSFIPGRVARVLVNGTGIAYVGELNPQVIVNFGLDMPVAAFELNLTELFEEIKKTV